VRREDFLRRGLSLMASFVVDVLDGCIRKRRL
jgi:hypothetical protein